MNISHIYATSGSLFGVREYPPHFKSLNKKPVRGGRWNVRKLKNGKWKAWSTGKTSRYSHNFYTHHGAVHWAHIVAYYHSSKGLPGLLLPKPFTREMDDLMKREWVVYRRIDLIHFIMVQGGVAPQVAIKRIIGDSQGALSELLADRSAINASLRGRK